MSGGHFDYNQYRIDDIINSIEKLIEDNDSEEKNEFGYDIGHHFRKEVINEFDNALTFLRKASIYTQRIDWLVSGDDGEDNFLKKLKAQLDAIEN